MKDTGVEPPAETCTRLLMVHQGQYSSAIWGFIELFRFRAAGGGKMRQRRNSLSSVNRLIQSGQSQTSAERDNRADSIDSKQASLDINDQRTTSGTAADLTVNNLLVFFVFWSETVVSKYSFAP